MHAALVRPLCGAQAVDLYAHVGGMDSKDKDIWDLPREEEKLLLRRRIGQVAGEVANVVSMHVYPRSYNATVCDKEGANIGNRRPDGTCLCGSYPQSYKLRACMSDMEARERTHRFSYDFVLRVRPDFEYPRALPLAKSWLALRRDTVWTLISTLRPSVFTGGFGGPFNENRVTPIGEVDYIDDNMAILPRSVAHAYMTGIANDLEQCVPNKAPHKELSRLKPDEACEKTPRWWWNECRIELALRAVNSESAPLFVGMLASSKLLRYPNWLDCKLGECAYPLRRGRGDMHHTDPFLSASLEPATFFKAALVEQPPSSIPSKEPQCQKPDSPAQSQAANRSTCTSGPAASRIAVCFSGEVRALVNERVPRNMHAALVRPLCGASSLDLYAHLSGMDYPKGSEFWNLPRAEQAGLMQGRLREVAGGLATVVNVEVYPKEHRPKECNKDKCLCGSYPLMWKLRACLEDMEAQEKRAEAAYDFILRARPDFEYFRALPVAQEWDRLRRDVVWAFIATRRGSRFFTGGFAADFLEEKVLPIEEVDFIDDNMAILPRKVARAYMKDIADEVEHCLPNKPPASLKKSGDCWVTERWWWNECRIEHALRSVREVPLSIGMLSNKGLLGHANWLNCLQGECAFPGRRDRGDAVRKAPFLQDSLPQSSFPAAALLPAR